MRLRKWGSFRNIASYSNGDSQQYLDSTPPNISLNKALANNDTEVRRKTTEWIVMKGEIKIKRNVHDKKKYIREVIGQKLIAPQSSVNLVAIASPWTIALEVNSRVSGKPADRRSRRPA